MSSQPGLFNGGRNTGFLTFVNLWCVAESNFENSIEMRLYFSGSFLRSAETEWAVVVRSSSAVPKCRVGLLWGNSRCRENRVQDGSDITHHPCEGTY